MKTMTILCSALALGAFTSAALAEPQAPAQPVELTDAQMASITAGQATIGLIIVLGPVQAILRQPGGGDPRALLLPAVQAAREAARR